MKVLHLITGLGQGGAERQLANLVVASAADTAVFSIMTPGVMADEIHAAGVPIHTGRAHSPLSPGWIGALRRTLHEFQPDIVMSWMYHGNLAACLTHRLGHHGPVIWNVRHSVHDLAFEKMTTRWVIRAGAWLSRQPARIVYNSVAAADQHETLGYAAGGRAVLPNGFDLERFKPDAAARARMRAEIGVTENEHLIGVIGRAHPMKNHMGWLTAFKQIINQGYPAHCVMMGSGVDGNEAPLHRAIRSSGLENHVTRLPPTSQPERVYPGLDLLVMPSLWGEGFPNVVGEAMACGVPAVVTPVGDAAAVVGETGFVSESTEASDLADAVAKALGRGRDELSALGARAQRRMQDHFSMEIVAMRYESLLRNVINH